MKKKRMNAPRAFRFRRFAGKAYSAFNSMHKVVNIGVLTAGMLVFAHATPTAAQTAGVASQPEMLPEEELEELEEVTVTAARVETPAGRAAKSVTVIRRAQIEQAPVQSIEELLNYVANIDVIQRGGHGVQADISLRGGSADQTAVLLNGVNFTNPHTGHYSFDLPVNLSDIERIEVIHGPAALVYGSGAFSGGINIVTKKEIDARLYANAKAGMYALHEAEVRGAAGVGQTKNSLSAGYRASDGYTAEHNSDYRLLDLLWQTAWEAGEASRLDLQMGYNRKQYGANTFYSALYPNQYEQTSAYVGSLKGSFGKALKCIPILYWNRHYDRFDLIRNTDTGRNFHRGDTYGANLVFQYTSRLGVTGLGGEWRREAIVSSNLGHPMTTPQGRYTHRDERTNTALTLEHTVEWKRLTVSAGALMSRNTLLESVRFYPSLSAVYRPLPALRFYTTWSRSTRLPTFTDLFYTTETHTADEGLKPERSESVDWGLRYSHPLVTASLTAYLMWGRDVIDWVRASGDQKWASWNLTGIDKQGVEAGLTFRPGERWPALGERTTLAVHYARMNQTCDSRGMESRYSLNYLRDKLTVQLNHPIYKGLSAGWYVRYQKRMGVFRKYEGTEDRGLHPFPAFSTLDLKLNYKQDNWNFYLHLNNLYDTYYYDIGNVPQAGRWLMGGVSYRLP
ncbi:MAG: TonB-dependent receptor [Tannerella sp.]|jgi:iron complex outermembrane receptor protein|nr:TonB-dependent receptor [Tannerella sp.]